MEYGRNIIEEKRSKLYSCLLRKSSAIVPLLYSFHNKKTLIEELHLFNDEFKMLLQVHKEYHQLSDDKFK